MTAGLPCPLGNSEQADYPALNMRHKLILFGFMAGVLYHLWFKFCFPLILKLSLAAAIVLVGAVIFDYDADVQPVIVQVIPSLG